MKEYTEQNPVFSDTIQITEITDAAHADNINAAPKQLLENTLVLKEKMEQLKKQIEYMFEEKIQVMGSMLATHQVKMDAVKAEVERLKLSLYSDMTANPFAIDFDNLERIKLTRGNHNKALARIEC